MSPNHYRLRPYHNPENVPWSAIPPGWRFLYRDEAGKVQGKLCRIWLPQFNRFGDQSDLVGRQVNLTYIVPVAA